MFQLQIPKVHQTSSQSNLLKVSAQMFRWKVKVKKRYLKIDSPVNSKTSLYVCTTQFNNSIISSKVGLSNTFLHRMFEINSFKKSTSTSQNS